MVASEGDSLAPTSDPTLTHSDGSPSDRWLILTETPKVRLHSKRPRSPDYPITPKSLARQHAEHRTPVQGPSYLLPFPPKKRRRESLSGVGHQSGSDAGLNHSAMVVDSEDEIIPAQNIVTMPACDNVAENVNDPDFHRVEKVESLGEMTPRAIAFSSPAQGYGNQTPRQFPMALNTPADCISGEFEFGGTQVGPNTRFERNDGVSFIALDTGIGIQPQPEIDPGNYGNIMFEPIGFAQDLPKVIIESGQNNPHGHTDSNPSSPGQNVFFDPGSATAGVGNESQPGSSPDTILSSRREFRLTQDDLSYWPLVEGIDISLDDLSTEIGHLRSHRDNVGFEGITTSHKSAENMGFSHEPRASYNVVFEMGDPSMQHNDTFVISTKNVGGDDLESSPGSDLSLEGRESFHSDGSVPQNSRHPKIQLPNIDQESYLGMHIVNANVMFGTNQPDTQSVLDEMRESRSIRAYNDNIAVFITENLAVRDSSQGVGSGRVMEQESDFDTSSYVHNVEFDDDDVLSRFHDRDQVSHSDGGNIVFGEGIGSAQSGLGNTSSDEGEDLLDSPNCRRSLASSIVGFEGNNCNAGNIGVQEGPRDYLNVVIGMDARSIQDNCTIQIPSTVNEAGRGLGAYDHLQSRSKSYEEDILLEESASTQRSQNPISDDVTKDGDGNSRPSEYDIELQGSDQDEVEGIEEGILHSQGHVAQNLHAIHVDATEIILVDSEGDTPAEQENVHNNAHVDDNTAINQYDDPHSPSIVGDLRMEMIGVADFERDEQNVTYVKGLESQLLYDTGQQDQIFSDELREGISDITEALEMMEKNEVTEFHSTLVDQDISSGPGNPECDGDENIMIDDSQFLQHPTTHVNVLTVDSDRHLVGDYPDDLILHGGDGGSLTSPAQGVEFRGSVVASGFNETMGVADGLHSEALLESHEMGSAHSNISFNDEGGELASDGHPPASSHHTDMGRSASSMGEVARVDIQSHTGITRSPGHYDNIMFAIENGTGAAKDVNDLQNDLILHGRVDGSFSSPTHNVEFRGSVSEAPQSDKPMAVADGLQSEVFLESQGNVEFDDEIRSAHSDMSFTDEEGELASGGHSVISGHDIGIGWAPGHYDNVMFSIERGTGSAKEVNELQNDLILYGHIDGGFSSPRHNVKFRGNVAAPQFDEPMDIADGQQSEVLLESQRNVEFDEAMGSTHSNISFTDEGGELDPPVSSHHIDMGCSDAASSMDEVARVDTQSPTEITQAPTHYGNITFDTEGLGEAGSAMDINRNDSILHGCVDGSTSSPTHNVEFRSSVSSPPFGEPMDVVDGLQSEVLIERQGNVKFIETMGSTHSNISFTDGGGELASDGHPPISSHHIDMGRSDAAFSESMGEVARVWDNLILNGGVDASGSSSQPTHNVQCSDSIAVSQIDEDMGTAYGLLSEMPPEHFGNVEFNEEMGSVRSNVRLVDDEDGSVADGLHSEVLLEPFGNNVEFDDEVGSVRSNATVFNDERASDGHLDMRIETDSVREKDGGELRDYLTLRESVADGSPRQNIEFSDYSDIAVSQVCEGMGAANVPPQAEPYGNVLFGGEVGLDFGRHPGGDLGMSGRIDHNLERSDDTFTINEEADVGIQLQAEVTPDIYGNIVFDSVFGSALDGTKLILPYPLTDGNPTTPAQNVEFIDCAVMSSQVDEDMGAAVDMQYEKPPELEDAFDLDTSKGDMFVDAGHPMPSGSNAVSGPGESTFAPISLIYKASDMRTYNIVFDDDQPRITLQEFQEGQSSIHKHWKLGNIIFEDLGNRVFRLNLENNDTRAASNVSHQKLEGNEQAKTLDSPTHDLPLQVDDENEDDYQDEDTLSYVGDSQGNRDDDVQDGSEEEDLNLEQSEMNLVFPDPSEPDVFFNGESQAGESFDFGDVSVVDEVPDHINRPERNISFGDPFVDAHYKDMATSSPDALATRQDMAILMLSMSEHPTRNAPPLPSPQARPSKTFDRTHRVPDKIILSRNVRDHAFRMMKRKKRTGRSKAVPFITSATREEVERYARTEQVKHGPSMNDFRLDLANSGLASAWNHRAILLFTKNFLDSHEYACRDEDAIGAAFKTHLMALKSQYKKFIDNEDEPVGVSAEKARQARRISQRGRRAAVAKSFAADPQMRPIVDTWEKIPWQACSGDETDTPGDRYVITNLPWRASEARPWMQVFDDLHITARFRPGRCRTVGHLPHTRVLQSSDQREERGFSAPVKGLPKNFYDFDWLENLDEHQKHNLNMQPAVDLTFPLRIMKMIKSNPLARGVGTGTAPVLTNKQKGKRRAVQ